MADDPLTESLRLLGAQRPLELYGPYLQRSPEEERAIEESRGLPAKAFDRLMSMAMGALGMTDYAEKYGRNEWARGAELASAAIPFMGAVKAARAAKAGTGGIRAFHGSPHDFDKFDMSKIGTGEGAQAYGHGLYFAENEATAKAYRDMWPSDQRGPRVKLDGQNLYELAAQARSPLEMRAYKRLIEDGDIDEAIRNAAATSAYPDPEVQRVLMEWKQTRRIDTPAGRMYEVQINADPESLLDWDKPLSQQSPQVSETLRRFGLYGPRKTGTGAVYDPPGSVAYDALQVPRTSRGNSVAASSTLREAGIPGIKYLDQGSRTAGEGTSNYVIFDDSLIDILKKYGLLPAAAGLGLTQGMQEQ